MPSPIPVLRLDEARGPGGLLLPAFLQRLREALHEVGFLQLTHGYLVATVHRVLPCAPGATRQSIGLFWSPRLDATLHPVPLRPELAAQAPGATRTQHNAMLPRFGDNALKGWIRSHPEVAARHHPDLVAADPAQR